MAGFFFFFVFMASNLQLPPPLPSPLLGLTESHKVRATGWEKMEGECMNVCRSGCRWLPSVSQSVSQSVLEAVGVYWDRPFNEVPLSLHTLVKESLSVCSPAASTPPFTTLINHTGHSCPLNAAVRGKCLAQGQKNPNHRSHLRGRQQMFELTILCR